MEYTAAMKKMNDCYTRCGVKVANTKVSALYDFIYRK